MVLNHGIIILFFAQSEYGKRRIGKALLFKSGWHAYDCCHATFNNVAMEIIIAAERETESRSVTMAEAMFCRAFWERYSPESVTLSMHETLLIFLTYNKRSVTILRGV